MVTGSVAERGRADREGLDEGKVDVPWDSGK